MKKYRLEIRFVIQILLLTTLALVTAYLTSI